MWYFHLSFYKERRKERRKNGKKEEWKEGGKEGNKVTKYTRKAIENQNMICKFTLVGWGALGVG